MSKVVRDQLTGFTTFSTEVRRMASGEDDEGMIVEGVEVEVEESFIMDYFGS